jgi:Sulfatase
MSSEPRRGAVEQLGSLPFYPVLLAVYPVLFLFSQNLGSVELRELFVPLVVVGGVATLALLALGVVLRDVRRAAIIVAAGAIALLAYGHARRVALEAGVPTVPFLAVWGGFVAVAVVVGLRAGARLPQATRALNVVAFLLVGLQLAAIVPFEARALTAGRVAAGPGAVAAAAGHTTRDIYYVVLDRYGSERSLELAYDIRDNDLYDWLADRGFAVARDSHANYVRTALSLASTLNMTFLDDVARAQGPESPDQGPIDAMLQDHAVGRFLKQAGYRYIHIGSYFRPTARSEIATVNRSLGGSDDFAAAVYDETVFPRATRALGIDRATPSDQRQADNARYQFGELAAVRSDPGPKFVFAHFLLPHPPYVFAPDGTFLDERARAGRSNQEQFADQVAYTNREVKRFLEPLLALPEEERPIIVLQADEGPYPGPYARDTINYDWSTATPDELEIKFGILNAFLLPGADPSLVYPTITSVNTFRLVLGEYFGADLPLLPDRVFTSKGKLRPYDLTDVTDRLPSTP